MLCACGIDMTFWLTSHTEDSTWKLLVENLENRGDWTESGINHWLKEIIAFLTKKNFLKKLQKKRGFFFPFKMSYSKHPRLPSSFPRHAFTLSINTTLSTRVNMQLDHERYGPRRDESVSKLKTSVRSTCSQVYNSGYQFVWKEPFKI